MWLGSGTPVTGGAIVAAVLLAVASPAGALYGTCAAIPLIFHPVAVGSLELSLLEVGILATFFGTCVRLLFDLSTGHWSDYRTLLRPWEPWVLVALLAVVGTGSLLWMPFSLHRAEALRTWRWVIAEPLMLFALARLAIARQGRIWLALAIALPGVLVSFAALVQFAESTSNFAVDSVHRSTATYLHPNNLALYLDRCFFLLLAPGLIVRGRRRWFFLSASAVILLALGVTFSRGGFLAVLIGSTVLLCFNPLRRGWVVLGSGLAGASILFAAIASQRLTGATSSGFGTTRRYLWSDAVQMLRDFPVTGIGLDQFLWLHQQRYIDPAIWNERYTSHPHNLVLDTWLSLGIGGLMLLAIIVGAGVWLLWSVRRGHRTLDPWQVGAVAALGAGLGHGLVDNSYFLPDLAALTWLCVAMVVARTTPLLDTHIGRNHDQSL